MTSHTANKKIEILIDELRDAPPGALFNQWWQRDEVNDDFTNSYEIRQHQLKAYLRERVGKTHFLLVGEAMGYQGGHFSGIAMTSERILLGHLLNKGVKPEDVFISIEPSRTSKVEVRKDGFTEPTASIVWGHLLGLGIDPYSFTIWNALPWHPYNPEKGYLSNRTPRDEELAAGHKHLHKIIEILQPEKIVAIGEKSAIQLNNLGFNYSKVRHPANGGATKFRDQFKLLLEKNTSPSFTSTTLQD